MIELTLPWPDGPLWPNRKAHWSVRAPAVKALRTTAWGLVCEAQNGKPGASSAAQRFTVAYTFCPATNRAFDLDNALGAMKGATDGIADALCVNDRHFAFQLERGAPVEGGAVKVRLTWPEAVEG